MLSDEQRKEIDYKVMKVVTAFIAHPYSMEKVSEITGISSSSVQRYLNDKNRIVGLFDEETYNYIQETLKEKTKLARRIGGLVSTTVNEPTRNENGKFTGNTKR